MQRCTFCRGLLWSLALLGLMVSFTTPAGAQAVRSPLDQPHFAIGYAANAPDIMAGVGAYYVSSFLGGIGLYVDAKFDLENPSDDKDTFESGLTAEDVVNSPDLVGADFIQDEKSYRSFNVAVVRPVSPYLAVYAGGGLVQVTEYHLFEDPDSDLGQGGVFWVEAPEFDETRANFMMGAFLRMSSFLSTQIGFETEPRGFTVGASLRLPRN